MVAEQCCGRVHCGKTWHVTPTVHYGIVLMIEGVRVEKECAGFRMEANWRFEDWSCLLSGYFMCVLDPGVCMIKGVY